MCRVEMWRVGCRLNISVAASFVWRCLSGSAMAPFPHPAHRTGQADFPHPALGQDFTPSPTARRAQAGTGVRAQSAPGEIIHIDIKKLGRFHSVGHRVTGRRTGYCSSQGAGWEFVHVAIDDHSRIARADILPDQKKESAVAFLVATITYFKSLGVTVERVMTDNGSCYLSKAFSSACRQLGIKHIRIKPYTPQTHGKAERFIQTALREWAYATAFQHSDQRRQALLPWLHRYNWHRPHARLAKKPPISRLRLTRNNLLRLHS